MALSHSPSIVTSNLLMCLDAANVKSYPGTGTTVSDIAGGGYTGTLVNSPTFVTTGQGSLSFDGNNQYMSFAQNTPTMSQMTVEVVCKLLNPTPQTTGFILGRSSSYRLIYSSSGFDWICSTSNNGWYTTGTTLSGSTTITNWNHVVCTYDGSRLRFYLNGVLVNTTSSDISGNVQNGSNFQMMNTDAANVSNGNGLISVARIYNTALTAANVRQNFNALRGRYGI